MKGGAWRPRGSRSPPHTPLRSPVVVGDERSVSGSGSNSWATKDGRKLWQKKKQNSPQPEPPKCDSHVSDTDETQKEKGQEPFDICPPKQGGSVVLKPSLLVKNRERRKEMKGNNNNNNNNKGGVVLRPGMVLLKGHIPISDQVEIVKKCRELGVGPGGFYQPGYGDDTKLHLKMMCLGKNWDPQSSQYGNQRPSDGAHPPPIPHHFLPFIHKAMEDSHALTPLPSFSPDICIVNFYSHNGRLGLHQDKDESQDSLRRGLPVVSFSIGDSADFLYGDHWDVDKAHKVVLESGDVLIFGGNSRNVFHGVTAIHPRTAPDLLLQQSNLRPGRLNLTFRQY